MPEPLMLNKMSENIRKSLEDRYGETWNVLLIGGRLALIGYSFRSKPGTYFHAQFNCYELISQNGGETYEIIIFQTPNLDLKTLQETGTNTEGDLGLDSRSADKELKVVTPEK